MNEVLRGARLLLGGFGWFTRRPGLMLLGLLPALIVSAGLSAALVALATALAPLTDAVTPFADDWPAAWAIALRVALGVAVFAGALLLAATTFTALTLIVGEPFYDRIWRSVEIADSGAVPDYDPGWRAAFADATGLIVRGALAAALAFALGFIPLIGGVVGTVTGVLLSGWILADELSGRALTARGIDRRARRRLLRTARGRALGFGIMTQLCFLIPLGAVFTMPAAVVGATRLAASVSPSEE
ncbi:EI24 domain-containing protein [Microbacterium sp. SORGH_AS_0862]|uniref:EI24 domain-containing protein n=1 Tax=Microbacterium sp. SORGH_AS_0862 TaxID=3041789 RepID=UPI0027925727|nr:EI24 domain-containing protein [Microbacterium sp. SORGH_AS_0862]MDQ1206335.1 CysZ protein [Microbacterium sp. SORGH_AS_0862]